MSPSVRQRTPPASRPRVPAPLQTTCGTAGAPALGTIQADEASMPHAPSLSPRPTVNKVTLIKQKQLYRVSSEDKVKSLDPLGWGGGSAST